jgi:Ca2+-binding RTX toxin-like protein
MEHVWDSLWSEWATGQPGRQAAVRVLQLAVQPVQPSADAVIRGESAQPFVLSLDRAGAAYFVVSPAVTRDEPRESAAESDLAAVTAAETPLDAPTAGSAERAGTVTFAGGAMATFGAHSQIVADTAANFAVLYSEDFQSALVVNMVNKTLLEGGPGNFPELGRGQDDVLDLTGDFSAGFGLPSQPGDIDMVLLGAGQDYNLIASEDNVAPGETMTIHGVQLGAGNNVIFDGSAETDGSFVFLGSQAGDTFLGGDGDDVIFGLGGGDTLAGGGGADRFVYLGASQSSGANYDTLGDFDPGADRIDLAGTVAGFGAAVTGGTLSHATFDADLGTAMAGLGAAQAAWFAPDNGDLAGTIFLVVDANGVAGYQEGEDYVFAVGGAPLADLTGHGDIFI